MAFNLFGEGVSSYLDGNLKDRAIYNDEDKKYYIFYSDLKQMTDREFGLVQFKDDINMVFELDGKEFLIVDVSLNENFELYSKPMDLIKIKNSIVYNGCIGYTLPILIENDKDLAITGNLRSQLNILIAIGCCHSISVEQYLKLIKFCEDDTNLFEMYSSLMKLLPVKGFLFSKETFPLDGFRDVLLNNLNIEVSNTNIDLTDQEIQAIDDYIRNYSSSGGYTMFEETEEDELEFRMTIFSSDLSKQEFIGKMIFDHFKQDIDLNGRLLSQYIGRSFDGFLVDSCTPQELWKVQKRMDYLFNLQWEVRLTSTQYVNIATHENIDIALQFLGLYLSLNEESYLDNFLRSRHLSFSQYIVKMMLAGTTILKRTFWDKIIVPFVLGSSKITNAFGYPMKAYFTSLTGVILIIIYSSFITFFFGPAVTSSYIIYELMLLSGYLLFDLDFPLKVIKFSGFVLRKLYAGSKQLLTRLYRKFW